MERIEEFLRGFCATLAAGKMYPVTHPQFKKVVDTTYEHLRQILQGKGELTIGLIENEIVYENRVLFKLSAIFELLITYAKKKGIEKVYFYSDIQKEEFVHFISFLLSPEEMIEDLEERLRLAGVNNIKASKLTTPEEEQKRKDQDRVSAYEIALKNLAQFYEKLAAGTEDAAPLQSGLKLLGLNIRDQLAGKDRPCPTALEGYGDELVRSLNVGILAMTVAAKLGFSPPEVLATGNAALLCQKDPRTLLKHQVLFGPLPIVVAFEGSRRPESPPKTPLTYCDQPHIVSTIVALCGAYEDIRKDKSGGEDVAARLRQVLGRDPAAGISPELLDKFLKIVSAS